MSELAQDLCNAIDGSLKRWFSEPMEVEVKESDDETAFILVRNRKVANFMSTSELSVIFERIDEWVNDQKVFYIVTGWIEAELRDDGLYHPTLRIMLDVSRSFPV